MSLLTCNELRNQRNLASNLDPMTGHLDYNFNSSSRPTHLRLHHISSFPKNFRTHRSCNNSSIDINSRHRVQSVWFCAADNCENSKSQNNSRPSTGERTIIVFSGSSKKFQKANSGFFISICPSVRPHGTTQFPLNGFPWNVIFNRLKLTLEQGTKAQRGRCIALL
jgi:hypothetical protein